MQLLPFQYEPLVEAALAEDVGTGDVTTLFTVPADTLARAVMRVKQNGVLAGLAVGCRAFSLIDHHVIWEPHAEDGDRVAAGTPIATITGSARAILTGERVALNLIQRLSGTATLTRQFVDVVEGTGASIVDTRKTTPGLRMLEKYAVRLGGAQNHRFGLYDCVLIKDNHIAAGGGVSATVRSARSQAPHTMKIEVECKSLEQVDAAIASEADIILLDNMDIDTLSNAVGKIRAWSRALTEASGGVRLSTVRAIAETGIDLISVGALTHSAPALDISLDFDIG